MPQADEREWRKWYSTARWKALRRAILTERPLCERCLAADIVEEGTVVHHVTPHRGDWERFWSGPFEVLCKPHHDSHGQLEDHGKKTILFGPDGWPL